MYFALALGTIALGLLVHLGGTSLGPVARDVLGDALWAAMIVWFTGILAPRARPWARWLGAYGMCVLVELSQLLHMPGLDALRNTRLGHLVLGNGFDPRDLLAYAAGVAVAALLDSLLIAHRHQARARPIPRFPSRCP